MDKRGIHKGIAHPSGRDSRCSRLHERPLPDAGVEEGVGDDDTAQEVGDHHDGGRSRQGRRLDHPTRAFGRGYPDTSPAFPTPPAPLQAVPILFCRHPHPARAFAGILMHFSGHPHPARAFVGIPMRFCRQPPPHPRLRRQATQTLLPAPPPRPRLWRSSPAPRGGQGQCVAISGEQPCLGRCLVCNRALVFSGISPCAGPWRYRHGGRG